MVHQNETIDFYELQAFASVIRHHGVTAAAAALGVSKSTVSMRVTRLEARLGTPLLQRSSRRVTLTREGERLLPRIQSILAESDYLFEEAGRARTAPRGTVRIAVTPALGGAVLAHLLPALTASYPDIALVVVPTYAFNDLQDPAFDFAIRVGRIGDEGLVASKLGTFARVLVCAPAHAAAGMTSSDMLAGVPLLAFSGQSPRIDWQLQKNDGSASVVLDLEAQCSVPDFDLLLQLARLGQGVAAVPDFMIAADLAAGRLVRVLPDWRLPPVDVMLAHRAGVSRLGRVAAVLALTRTAVMQVLEGGRVKSADMGGETA